MAKKPTRSKTKTKAKPKPASEAATAKDLMAMPSESIVRSVASDITSTRKSTGKLTDELKEIVGDAKRDKGIHPGSLKRVEAWVFKAKKSDRGLAAIATELAHLDYYRDVLGLDDMIKKQGQMFARTEAGEKETDEPELPGATARGTEETAGERTIQ